MNSPVRVVLFDLLTALLDSWTLWNRCAGSPEAGRRWRMRYLELTYGCGDYVDYERLTRDSALQSGLPEQAARDLVEHWDEMRPWPEVAEVLRELEGRYRLGVVTNCSEVLGRRATALLGVPIHVVTSERAGAYKPDARPYQLALTELGVAPAEAVFVAGSPSDIGGARGVGMPVFWHNRIGLARPAHGPAPDHEARTLNELPSWLEGHSSGERGR